MPTAAHELPHDRVDDWLDEVGRIAERLSALTPDARAAVESVLAAFAREDGASVDLPALLLHRARRQAA